MHGKILYTLLNANSAFRAACGVDSGGNVKLYPSSEVPQGLARPYAAYTRVSRVFDHNKDERGMQTINVQIDFYATGSDKADEMEETAMVAIDHYRGTVAGYKVKSIRIHGGGSGYNSDQESQHRSAEFSIRVNP